MTPIVEGMSSSDHPQPAPEPDPAVPHTYEQESPFAFGDAKPIGETDRITREKAIYDAARTSAPIDRGHAVGGSGGATEGR